jgi:glyoxylase-like metal-dependent hydrolase (beta-lactamase superfamily II)
MEVADRVYQRRYDPLDVSVCVVRGTRGLLVVDTRSSHREADEIRADLRWFGGAAVVAVVNTHAHFDHCFGNHRFGPGSGLNAPIYGHERMPAHLTRYEEPLLKDWIEQGVEPVEDWREVVITPPTHLVGELTALDLGDRSVELIHLGRGHTDNDLLLHVPDAATWLVGDLLEESGPPMYGSGSFPLDWPGTIGLLRERLVASAMLVPGHGAPVGPGFAVAQHAELQRVAALIRELHAAGVPADQALAAGGDRWPYPPDQLGSAVSQGYLQLGCVR